VTENIDADSILERRGEPVERIEMTSKSVEVEGASYNLQKSISLGGKSISLTSTSITLNEEDAIEESISTTKLCNSKSRLSLHGVGGGRKLHTSGGPKLHTR
jgi:molecular chaperone HtpG